MPDWMRPESMRRDMMVTVLTYRGLTSGRLLKTPAMSTDPHHENAVFTRILKFTEKHKYSIKRMLIAHRMDPDSPIHDVVHIWDSGPVIELAERIYEYEPEAWDSVLAPEIPQEPIKVKPKKQLPGVVSGSLDGIRAQFRKEKES